jgi:hypothetical protein
VFSYALEALREPLMSALIDSCVFLWQSLWQTVFWSTATPELEMNFCFVLACFHTPAAFEMRKQTRVDFCALTSLAFGMTDFQNKFCVFVIGDVPKWMTFCSAGLKNR